MSRKKSGPPSNPLTLPGAAAGWKHSAAMRWLLLLLFVFLFYFSIAPKLVPETYDITLNSKSDKIIRAPHQVVDEIATSKAQEAAAAKVGPIYSIVALRNEVLIDDIFTRIEQLNQDDQISEADKVDIYRRVIPERVDQFVSTFLFLNANNKTSEIYSAGLMAEMERVVLAQKYSIPEETFYKSQSLRRVN
jgi:membrane-associated HD superfamily phosphohydrolase